MGGCGAKQSVTDGVLLGPVGLWDCDPCAPDTVLEGIDDEVEVADGCADNEGFADDAEGCPNDKEDWTDDKVGARSFGSCGLTLDNGHGFTIVSRGGCT